MDNIIPFRYCQCGCGGKTRLNRTNRRNGKDVKGQPRRFIKGHTVPAEVRFWSKVDKSGECWEWLAAKNKHGYGVFCPKGQKTVKAHRFAYELANGPIPSGKGPHGTCLLHSCDNPGCVRPSHLTPGSQLANIADMFAKGRSKINSNPVRGSKHPNAKLTENVASEIRKMAASMGKRQSKKQIAAKFGIDLSTVYRVINNEIWQTVSE